MVVTVSVESAYLIPHIPVLIIGQNKYLARYSILVVSIKCRANLVKIVGTWD